MFISQDEFSLSFCIVVGFFVKRIISQLEVACCTYRFQAGFPRTWKTLKTWKMKNKFPGLEKPWERENNMKISLKILSIFENTYEIITEYFS